MFNDTVTGSADPAFQISERYPITGNIAGSANLTVSVIPALTVMNNLRPFGVLTEPRQ